MENINWKDIPGWYNYEISNTGIVRNKYTGQELKQFSNKTSGPFVTLSQHGRTQSLYVARLLLTSFSPIPNPEMHQVNYLDKNRKNISLDNLRWKEVRGNRMYTDIQVRELQDDICEVIEKWFTRMKELNDKNKTNKEESRVIKW